MSQLTEQILPHAERDEVRDFYDRYPYPPPVDDLDKYRRLYDDPKRRLADYYLLFPTRSYTEDQSILIAGCGTSQAAKYALRWPGAQVTGIDVSATSVECTDKLRTKYKLNNLHIYQLPLQRTPELATSFDQIICTGVLHHLADPDDGLSVLRSMLKPEGAMHLMVYAPYGRAGIYMLQEFCRRIGIHATDAGIRDLISTLRALPPGHPLESLLKCAPDLGNQAALADALLHPQDRAYSVPQLFNFVEKGGLTFGRWLKQAPYSPHCGAVSRIPQASQLLQLPPLEQYAAVELFRGTMLCHSMVVYRDDCPTAPQPVNFSGDSWHSYVPLRMPDTLCIHERLPPGAASVLINRNHTCKDLVMPIDSTEKRLFDAIDGYRCIGEIAETHCDPRRPTCQATSSNGFGGMTRWCSKCRDVPGRGCLNQTDADVFPELPRWL